MDPPAERAGGILNPVSGMTFYGAHHVVYWLVETLKTGRREASCNPQNEPKPNRKGSKTMKKLLLSILGLMTLTAVHAQQTVVIERPGIFTDLANAATALVTLPVAAATGIVEGTVEAFRDVVTGSTIVIATPAPVAVPPRVIVPAPVVTPAPVVVAPSVAAPAPAVVVAPSVAAPAVVPSTTIITRYGDGSVTTVTRQASAYELGPNVVVPVDPAHRVGTSPHVNPYVFRYR